MGSATSSSLAFSLLYHLVMGEDSHNNINILFMFITSTNHVLYHLMNESIYILEMCSVSTNGDRASPAQQGSQLIGCHLSYLP